MAGNAPLPSGRQASPTKHGNAGLVYNKLFDRWDTHWTKLEPQGKDALSSKLAWIVEGARGGKAGFDGSKRGDSDALRRAAVRVADLVARRGGDYLDLSTAGPFVTGLGLNHPIENGFLWHHSLGVPYLPGSSVKGLVRAWLEHWEEAEKDETRRLFGGTPDDLAAGSLVWFDALPTQPVPLIAEILTAHDDGWRLSGQEDKTPADWVSPNPIPFLAAGEDTRLRFAVAPRDGRDEAGDVPRLLDHLREALDRIGAGAKTAIGFGRFGSIADAEARRLLAWSVGDHAVFFDRQVEIVDINPDKGEARLRDLDSGKPIKKWRPLAKLLKPDPEA